MALARVKSWNPGDTLTAGDLNAEFNNILNNPITLISPATAAINFQTSIAHTNLVASVISGSSGGGLPAALSIVRGLVGTITTGQTVTLSADQYLLQTTAQFPTFFPLTSTSAFTVNVGTSGPAANGRDVGPVFSSTFVHCYAITTGAGSTTPAGIASTTPPPTGPVLPTNYSAWTYLGTYPYSSSSTTFSAAMRQRGAAVLYEARQVTLSGGASTTEASVSYATVVPSQAGSYLLDIEFSNASGATATHTIRVVSGVDCLIQNAANGDYGHSEERLPTIGSSYFYLLGAASMSATHVLHGYHVPNGGE